MHDDSVSTSPLDAEAVRAKLMGNRVPDEVLAAALGVGLRSVYGYAEKGMPFIRIGGRRLFDVDEVREWMVRRKVKAAEPDPAPRPVGRPRKQ